MKKQLKYLATAGLLVALLWRQAAVMMPRTKSLRLSPIRRWRML